MFRLREVVGSKYHANPDTFCKQKVYAQDASMPFDVWKVTFTHCKAFLSAGP